MDPTNTEKPIGNTEHEQTEPTTEVLGDEGETCAQDHPTEQSGRMEGDGGTLQGSTSMASGTTRSTRHYKLPSAEDSKQTSMEDEAKEDKVQTKYETSTETQQEENARLKAELAELREWMTRLKMDERSTAQQEVSGNVGMLSAVSAGECGVVSEVHSSYSSSAPLLTEPPTIEIREDLLVDALNQQKDALNRLTAR